MAKRRRIAWIVVGLLAISLAGGGAWYYNRFNSGPRLLTRARVAVAAGNFPKAEALALKYVREAPGDWRGHYTLATAYQRQGNYERARAALGEAARLNPRSVDVVLALGETHSQRGAAIMAKLEASDPNEIRAAIAGLVKADEVLSKFQPDPNDQAALLKVQESRGMGLVALAHARSTLVRKMTAPAKATDPVRQLFETEAYRAEIKAVQAAAQEARLQATQLLLDVVQKDPSRDVPATTLVALCIEGKDLASLELARKAIDTAKKPSPIAALTLARYDLSNTGNDVASGRQATLGRIIARVQAILDANPDSKDAKNFRAELALTAGDPATAERLTQEVLKSQANDGFARLLHARALLDSGREAQAEKELYGLKTTSAQWPAAHYWYARAADAAGKPELAREAMRAVTQLEKDPALQQQEKQLFRGAHQYLADRLAKDFPSQAFEEAKACYEFDANDLPDLEIYVRAAIGIRQSGLARQALDRAMKNRPGDPQILDVARKGFLEMNDPNDRARAIEVARQAAGITPAGIPQLNAVVSALDFLGRGAEADRLVSRIAENDPNNPVAQLALAGRYAATGRQYQAIDQCRRAVALDPNEPNYRVALAGALMEARELDEARTVLEPILATNSKARELEAQVRVLQGKPIDRDVLGGGRGRSDLALASSCLAGGQVDRGIEICKAELERDPQAPAGWHLLLGQAYLAQGKTDECIRAWSAGIKAHPQSYEFYHNIALLASRRQAGPDEIGRQLSAIPGAHQGLVDFTVAGANAGRKQYAAAAELYAKVVANITVADALRYQARIERANALGLDNKADEAVAELDKLIKDKVQPVKTALAKARLLAEIGRPDEAATVLTNELTSAETNRDARSAVGIAELLLQLRKFDKALAACDTVQRLLPNEPPSYVIRATIFQQTGRGAEVPDLYRKAIALQPTRLEYHVALAESLDARDDLQQALEALQGMTGLGRPGKVASLLHQGRLLVRWGLTKEAAQCLDPLAELANTSRERLVLADCFTAAGHKDKAASLLLMVPRDAPEHLRAQLMLADLAETPRKKLACLEAVNAQAADSDLVLSRKMNALIDDNRAADALMAFAQAVDAKQNNPQPMPASANLALKAALRQGDLAGARMAATMLAAMSGEPSWRTVVDEINLELDPGQAAKKLPAPDKASLVQVTMGLCLARQAGDAQALKAWADRLEQLARGEPTTRTTSRPGETPAPHLPRNLRFLCALVVGNETEIQAAAGAIAPAGSVDAQAASELRQFVAANADANKTTRQLSDLLKAELASGIQRPEFASFWAGRALEARPQCQWAALQMRLASLQAAAFGTSLDPQSLKRTADLLEPRDCPLARELQADACMQAGQFDQVLKLYAALAEPDKSNPTWTRLQASALERAGDPENASQHAENIKKAVELYHQAWQATKDASNCNNWAYLVCEAYPQDKAKLAEAQKAMDELARRQTLRSGFRDTVGWIAFHQGRIDDACRNLRQAVRAQPDSAEMHYHLGLAESAAGNKPLARMHLKQAAAIGQELREVRKKDPAKIVFPSEVQAAAKARAVLREQFPGQ
jgi:tetratricopeptide (TPR) repeat protein